tara:strand:- start:6219 stop:6542 length:324 start_codon:yes stop_codon:yes gene_type:complete
MNSKSISGVPWRTPVLCRLIPFIFVIGLKQITPPFFTVGWIAHENGGQSKRTNTTIKDGGGYRDITQKDTPCRCYTDSDGNPKEELELSPYKDSRAFRSPEHQQYYH